MLVSVIVRTKDEAARLRLVLASLSRQTLPIVAPGTRMSPRDKAVELIIVNDGSNDETRPLLEDTGRTLPLLALHHAEARGRSAASNAGAWAASGDLLLFLDGDTLAAQDWAAVHGQKHEEASLVGRGEVYNLRCTRFFHDPETGSPQPG